MTRMPDAHAQAINYLENIQSKLQFSFDQDQDEQVTLAIGYVKQCIEVLRNTQHQNNDTRAQLYSEYFHKLRALMVKDFQVKSATDAYINAALASFALLNQVAISFFDSVA